MNLHQVLTGAVNPAITASRWAASATWRFTVSGEAP